MTLRSFHEARSPRSLLDAVVYHGWLVLFAKFGTLVKPLWLAGQDTGQALVIGWTGHWSSPCDWLWGIVLPIYKGKGSKYGCSSYSPGHHRPLCCGQSILLTRIKPHLQPGRREQSEFTHHGCVVARSIMERITHHGYDGLTLGKEVLQIRTSLMIWLLCLRRLKSCSWAWSRPPVASAMYLQQFPFSAVRLTSWIALYSIGANDQDV